MNKQNRTNRNRFNQHLKTLRERSGQTVSAIAKQLNIHRNSQVNYEIDRDPNIDYLLAFCDVVDTSFWRLIGERVKLSNGPQRLIDKALNELGPIYGGIEKSRALYLVTRDPDQRPIGLPQARTMPDVFQNLINQYEDNSAIAVYQQYGQAMVPKICDQDWLVIDTDDTDIEDGKIYFIKIGQEYAARRLQATPSSEWLVTSDNPQFAPITISHQEKKQLKIIGKMICFISQCH